MDEVLGELKQPPQFPFTDVSFQCFLHGPVHASERSALASGDGALTPDAMGHALMTMPLGVSLSF